MTANAPGGLDALMAKMRACRLCADRFAHEPRPVFQLSAEARIAIVGQAPGVRVHESGRPFTDPSGDRLRDWMGVDEATFYDERRIAIAPAGLCFPGLNEKGSDLPPPKICARTWQDPIFAQLPKVELIILVGRYGQIHHLGERARPTLTETVMNWREYGPLYLPLPHPSWRNNVWIKKNPWFSDKVLPELKARIAEALADCAM